MDRSIRHRRSLGASWFCRLILVAEFALVAVSTMVLASEPCGSKTYPFPYADVSTVTDPFCPGIMEAYVTGISKGTTPTTFSPNETVNRLQMTTFIQRTVDQVLTRSSKRAALNQWWTPTTSALQSINLTGNALFCAADGENIWTTDDAGNVYQIQASTGTVLKTWTGATSGQGVLVSEGKVYVAGFTQPGNLYVIDPTLPAGPVTAYDGFFGNGPTSIAFDGTNLWSANLTSPGSVSIGSGIYTTGFSNPVGILYDGTHMWVTDETAGTLFKLDASANILQTVAVGAQPQYPVFDGANIWVPNYSGNSITVVQASTGNVVATITTNGINKLSNPEAASFDGERVLVTNAGNNSVTVFKAADLSFIANVSTGSQPYGACSDGINFWIAATPLIRF